MSDKPKRFLIEYVDQGRRVTISTDSLWGIDWSKVEAVTEQRLLTPLEIEDLLKKRDA